MQITIFIKYFELLKTLLNNDDLFICFFGKTTHYLSGVLVCYALREVCKTGTLLYSYEGIFCIDFSKSFYLHF